MTIDGKRLNTRHCDVVSLLLACLSTKSLTYLSAKTISNVYAFCIIYLILFFNLIDDTGVFERAKQMPVSIRAIFNIIRTRLYTLATITFITVFIPIGFVKGFLFIFFFLSVKRPTLTVRVSTRKITIA